MVLALLGKSSPPKKYFKKSFSLVNDVGDLLSDSSLKSIVELHLGFHEALRLVGELYPRLLVKKYLKFSNAVPKFVTKKRREKKTLLTHF